MAQITLFMYDSPMIEISDTNVLQEFKLLPNELSGKIANGIGLVAPFDFALDDECRRWLSDDIPMFVTRTPELESADVTVELAKEVSSELAVAPAVKSLLAVNPAAIGYACTSGSFIDGVEGERRLQHTMIAAGAEAAVTTSGALVQALNELGIKRIGIVTPYNHDLSQLLVDYLREAGFEVATGGYLGMEHDIARISTSAIQRLAESINRPDIEAIFFSCTNLQTFDIIEKLEAYLSKPVLSANQVTMWAVLRAGGLRLPVINQRLFQRTSRVEPSNPSR